LLSGSTRVDLLEKCLKIRLNALFAGLAKLPKKIFVNQGFLLKR